MPKGLCLFLLLPLCPPGLAEVPSLPDTCLVISQVRQASRAATRSDPIEQQFVLGTWKAPEEGAEVARADGSTRSWTGGTINAEGRVEASGLRGAYVYVPIESPREQVVLLHARGHSMVYVNGAPRGGDPYNYGNLKLPIRLNRGTNELVFSVSRGFLQVKLERPPAGVYISSADMTLPDHLDDGEKWLGLVVINATNEWQEDLQVTPRGQAATPIGAIAPLTLRKVPVRVTGGPEYSLQLNRKSKPATVSLRKRNPEQVHRRTFLSKADGSVQYYAVRPATQPGPDNALILSLHGASVEAQGQAEAYGPHDWATIVAPTNRRPFGFDWEDWGRVDALEVLEDAARHYPHDPQRTCLTGHSMGGHGTWQLGALFPDKWAAIGPSAGWISFSSYTGASRPTEDDALSDLLRRGTSTSNTLAMKQNYNMHGIYILHGDADDNVPVGQARQMKTELADHPNLHYHEQEGAGHWWDGDPAPGAACVDFKPMFDLFQKSRRPKVDEVREIDFTTVNPEVSPSCYWITIVAQSERLKPSRVQATWDPDAGQIVCETENVLEIAFDLDALGAPGAEIRIDGFDTVPGARTFLKAEDRWLDLRMVTRTRPDTRGSFKNGLWNRGGATGPLRALLGRNANPELERALFDKARFDAETFYYRGNGNVEIVQEQVRDRFVLTYIGKPVTEPMVRVGAGSMTFGTHTLRGDDLAFLSRGYQRVDIGGTGPVGVRLTHRMAYFVSGIDYPDLAVFQPDMLSTTGLGGVVGAGLGQRWVPAEAAPVTD